MGFKAPRGYGWLTNPKRAAYNRVYNRTTVSADRVVALGVALLIPVLGAIFVGILRFFTSVRNTNQSNSSDVIVGGEKCPRCHSSMILRDGKRGKFYGCSLFPRCRGTRVYIVSEAIKLDHTASS